MYGLSTRRTRRTLVLAFLLAITGLTVRAQVVPEGFTLTVINDEIGRDPSAMALLPDERVLILSHQSDGLRLMVEGEVREDPLLTFPDLKTSSEQGGLGLAVDPEYPDSNYVYVFRSVKDSTNRVTRYTVAGALDDPSSTDLTIDRDSARDILVLEDSAQYHNGGTIRFGPDGMLYVSHGDDLKMRLLQDLTAPNGKILRIRRDGSIPSDNPTFEDAPENARPDIFAFGLRNPFRFAVDPETGELLIGDVGTNQYEELNLASGGENFGYPHYEGSPLLDWSNNPSFDPERYPLIGPEVTPPLFAYAYGAQARSVVPVVAYRQRDFPHDHSFPSEFEGAYFFADFFGQELKVLQPGVDGLVASTFATGFRGIVDGAIAPDGGIYVLEYGSISARDGTLSKITYTGSVASEQPARQHGLVLDQNFPNPVTDRTEIRFQLRQAAEARVTVVDMLGREVAVLADGHRSSGWHAVTFDAAGLPAGVYLYRLEAGGVVVTKNMVIL